MVFITEQQLDDAASAIQEDETINESLVTELSEIQPAVFAFLFTENTELFTEYEKEYLLFILLTLWQAIRTQIDVEDMDEIDSDELSLAEEKIGNYWNPLQPNVFEIVWTYSSRTINKQIYWPL